MKAIILVAGIGNRLKPFTKIVPKCLTEVNGEPILLNALEILDKKKFEEVVLVTGCLHKKIYKKIGNKFGNLKIKYVYNDIYYRTNNMYSLWLARDYFKNGFVLIEGDCFFEEKIIDRVIECDDSKSYWVIDSFDKFMDGCRLTTNRLGRIVDLEIVKNSISKTKSTFFKSVGILKINRSLSKSLSKWLKEEIDNKNTNIYYDVVFKKHLEEEPIYACNVDNLKWVEIDDFHDLRVAEEKFKKKNKIIFIVADGASDNPLKKLKDKTPLEVANIPNIDFLTREGCCGMLKTSFKKLPVGSIVAHLGILGYRPIQYYPFGRASFEALAQNIKLKKDDIAFRCNLISLDYEENISDFTASKILDKKASKIIEKYKGLIAGKYKNKVELCHGQSYRNILILRDSKISPKEIVCYEPHNNIGNNISNVLIKGKTSKGIEVANFLNNFMLDSITFLREIKIEIDSTANMLWLWSASSKPDIPSFTKKYNMRGAIVCGSDFLKGIASVADMSFDHIPTATGYMDTDYEKKLENAICKIKENDFVLVHINAPDEESHQGNIQNKIKSIELIDKKIVGPLLKYMKDSYFGDYVIVFLPDHYTFTDLRVHGDKPVPFAIYSPKIKRDDVCAFSEDKITKRGKLSLVSYNLIDFLLKKINLGEI